MSYAKIAADVAALVESKQVAYGDSFGKSGAVMRILYPDGIPPEKLDDALTIVRVLDKLFRIATSRDALGESPWRDLMGYSLLAVARSEEKETPKPETKRNPMAWQAVTGETIRRVHGDGGCAACLGPDRDGNNYIHDGCLFSDAATDLDLLFRLVDGK